MLRELRRVARLGVVVNDLDRSMPAWIGAWLLVRVASRNRYTRHDGPLSVRRAYRAAEVTPMAAATGLGVIHRVDAPGGHRYALALAALDGS
jgi:hypothetical protein